MTTAEIAKIRFYSSDLNEDITVEGWLKRLLKNLLLMKKDFLENVRLGIVVGNQM